ncbi:SAM-dependent methyltransferase [Brevundimonas sp.]|uniref:SAM-dependent methyltransferase n=1 Tax=Brevundimonas sp. TaxID=1871086 RepID=UPI003A92AC08
MSPAISYHCLGYAALEVCNPFDMAAVDAVLTRTGLRPRARALDIGTGNGAIAIRLADRFGLEVTAVELDAAMADIARARISASPAADRIVLRQGRSGDVLADIAPLDLIVATGVTDPIGDGRLEPAAILAALSGHLKPGGWLLWGDLIWNAEPPVPVRQIFELVNRFTTHEGTHDDARAAGFEVVSAEISPRAAMDHYIGTADREARAWLADHPDAPEAAAIRTAADRVKITFQFGGEFIDFGLYLLHKPPI